MGSRGKLTIFVLVAAGAVAWLLLGGPGSGPGLDSPSDRSPEEGADRVGTTREPDAHPGDAEPLAGPGALRGRLVRGLRRHPIEGRVVVSSPDGGSAKAEAGPDGNFELTDLPVGEPLDLEATSPGLLPARLSNLVIPPAGELALADLVLGPGERVRVEVVDGTARPVAGARVALVRRTAPRTGSDWISIYLSQSVAPEPEAELETSEEGTAVFDAVPPAAYRVLVEAEGFGPTQAWLAVTEGRAREPLRVVLRSACSLTGTVYGPEGSPLAGILLRAGAGGWGAVAGGSETTSDESGAYRFDALPEGVQSILVVREPGSILTVGSVRLPAVERFDIHLPEGATVRGVVLDDETGEPVAGATATLSTYSANAGLTWSGQAVTGPDGTFALEGIPAGYVNGLQVRKEGYLSWPDAKAPGSNRVTTIGSGEVRDHEIRLRRGVALSGRVLGPGGEPVSGASIQLWMMRPDNSLQWSPNVRSGEDGVYRFEAVEPGVRGILQVEAEGYTQPGFPRNVWQGMTSGTRPEAWSVTTPEEGAATKDLVLARGGTITGKATLEEGGPAAGFVAETVSTEAVPGGGLPARTAAVTADGTFRIEGIPAGESFRVRVSGPGGRTGESEPVTLEDGEVRTDVAVTVGSALVLGGTVRREDGRELAGAILRLAEGVYDPNQPWLWQSREMGARPVPVTPGGAFEVDGLRPGKYTLFASAPGAAETRVETELTEGETNRGLLVVLPPGLTIQGTVLGPDGAPVGGALVSVQSMRGNQYAGFTQTGNAGTADAVTGPDGRFEVRDLPKGSVTVRVRATGFVEAGATARPGGEDVTIRLARGAAIAGVVTDATTGKPLAGIPVQAMPSSPQPGGVWVTGQTETAEDGSFRMSELSPGKYQVTAGRQWGPSGDGYTPKQVADVETGTTDLRIALSRGLAITGRFLDERGDLIPGIRWVQAVGRGPDGNADYSRQRSTSSKPDGTFEIGGLQGGVYDLTVQSTTGDGDAWAAARVENVSAGATGVQIVLRKGQPISGRVVDGEGEPWTKGGWIRLEASDGAGSGPSAGTVARVEADGTFRTGAIEAGTTWDLSFMSPQSGIPVTVRGVRAGAEDVVVKATAGGRISGVVLDEKGRRVGAGVAVAAAPEGGGSGLAGRTRLERTDENGEFVIENLAGDRFRVSAGGRGSKWRVTYAPGTWPLGAEGVTIRLEAGVRIAGRVVSPTGDLPEQITLGAETDDEERKLLNWTRVNDDGTFEIGGLPAGPVRLRAFLPSGRVDCGRATAPATDLQVTLPE